MCIVSDLRGGLNGSMRHGLGLYSQESESLAFFSGADLDAVLLCPDVIG
jgi:hypothetical protein